MAKQNETSKAIADVIHAAALVAKSAALNLPQHGNSPEDCQRVALIQAINELEAVANGICAEDTKPNGFAPPECSINDIYADFDGLEEALQALNRVN